MNDKKMFQIERIAFFSDAVFAIAITLLIIEIKAPVYDMATTFSQSINEFLHLIPEFIAVLISFALIAMHWRRSHQVFGIIEDYDGKIIVLNLMVLATIIFLPFSTSFIAKNYARFWQEPLTLPFVVYSFNNFACAFCDWRLFRYALDPKNKLFDPARTDEDPRRLILEVGFAAIVFSVTTLVGWFSHFAALACFALFAAEPLFIKWRLAAPANEP